MPPTYPTGTTRQTHHPPRTAKGQFFYGDYSAAMIAINTGLVMVLIRMPSRAKVRPTL